MAVVNTQQLSLINVKMYKSMFGIIKEFEQVLVRVPALFQSVNLPVHISAKACQAWRCYLFQLKLRFSTSLCCLSGSAKTSPPLSPSSSLSLSQYGTNCVSYRCILYRVSNVLMCMSLSSSIMNNSSFSGVLRHVWQQAWRKSMSSAHMLISAAWDWDFTCCSHAFLCLNSSMLL